MGGEGNKDQFSVFPRRLGIRSLSVLRPQSCVASALFTSCGFGLLVLFKLSDCFDY